MIGPGKYDDACTAAREMAQAEAAIVIILNGNKGSGFSIQGDVKASASLTVEKVAALLQHVAAEMLRDAERLRT
jgi:hypothetical protein